MTSPAQHDGQDAAESGVVYAANCSSVLAGEGYPFACFGPSFRASSSNQPARDADGRIAAVSVGMHRSSRGMLWTDWSELSAGQRLFVQLPDGQEFVHVCPNLVVPSQGPLVVRLAEQDLGTLMFRCRGEVSGAAPPLHIQVEEVGAKQPVRYLLEVPRAQARVGWEAQGILPGTYHWSHRRGDSQEQHGQIVVGARQQTLVEFD